MVRSMSKLSFCPGESDVGSSIVKVVEKGTLQNSCQGSSEGIVSSVAMHCRKRLIQLNKWTSESQSGGKAAFVICICPPTPLPCSLPQGGFSMIQNSSRTQCTGDSLSHQVSGKHDAGNGEAGAKPCSVETGSKGY